MQADLVRLAQVVANLLNNAAKYTPDGGQIALTVGQEGDEAVVRVRDNGIGMPAGNAARACSICSPRWIARSTARRAAWASA